MTRVPSLRSIWPFDTSAILRSVRILRTVALFTLMHEREKKMNEISDNSECDQADVNTTPEHYHLGSLLL